MARRNAVVAVLALVAVAVGSLLWLNRDERAARTVRHEDGFADEPVREHRPPAEPAEKTDTARPEPTPADESPALPPLLAHLEQAALRGTIVAVDPDGNEHARESGSFTLWVYRDGMGFRLGEIEVTDGRWTASPPKGVTLTFLDVRLGGRLAFTPQEAIPIPEDGVVALRARWPAPARLAVVADDTGQPLDDVVVAGAQRFGFNSTIHPGPKPAIVAKGNSPVALPERQGARQYWARAPGYAWATIRYDHRAGGEREVRLVKGGDLEIELVNFDPAAGALVRLYEKNKLQVETKPERATVLLTDLPARAFEVRVEIGRYWSHPTRLGTAEVEVVAGARTKVSVTLERHEGPEEVPLEGTLVVPDAWGDVSPRLWLSASPRGVPKPRITLDGRRWRAKPAFPGRYVVTAIPFQMQFVLDVGPSGLLDARLEIPEPADVVVTVLDADTGEPAPVETVHWSVARPKGVTGGSLTRAKRDSKTGKYTFRAPVGAVDLDPWDDHYDAWARRVDVRPGRNEFTLEVRRACGIHLVLKDGDATVPTGSALTVRFEDLDGDGQVRSTGSDGVTKTFRFSRPSRYRITFAELEGFKPIPPRVVTVGRGEMVEVEVPLERTK